MKKIMLLLFAFPVSSAFSADVNLDQVANERAEWTKRHFAAQGSPIPDGGVVVYLKKKCLNISDFKPKELKKKTTLKSMAILRRHYHKLNH